MRISEDHVGLAGAIVFAAAGGYGVFRALRSAGFKWTHAAQPGEDFGLATARVIGQIVGGAAIGVSASTAGVVGWIAGEILGQQILTN